MKTQEMLLRAGLSPLVICVGVPMGVQTSTHTHRPKGVGHSHGCMGANPWWVYPWVMTKNEYSREVDVG